MKKSCLWIVCCVFALTACGQKNEGELLTEETLKEDKKDRETYSEENGYWQEKDSSSEKVLDFVTGMKETEIQSLGLPFEKFAKEDLFDESKSVAFAGNVIRDEKNPINTADFDSLYVYVDAMPEEEMTEYGIYTTSCVSIVALIKNETISHIILDMPTAG